MLAQHGAALLPALFALVQGLEEVESKVRVLQLVSVSIEAIGDAAGPMLGSVAAALPMVSILAMPDNNSILDRLRKCLPVCRGSGGCCGVCARLCRCATAHGNPLLVDLGKGEGVELAELLPLTTHVARAAAGLSNSSDVHGSPKHRDLWRKQASRVGGHTGCRQCPQPCFAMPKLEPQLFLGASTGVGQGCGCCGGRGDGRRRAHAQRAHRCRGAPAHPVGSPGAA